MFSWRARRQLTVLAVLAAVVVGTVLLIVPKFFPEPTCFDNKKNQGELNIDCGGPCGPCELKNPRALSIFWARAALVRPQTFDVAAEVENLNEELSSTNVEYEFSLFDELGEVARKVGRTFISPQERLHIVETNLTTSRVPTRVEFRIKKIDWQFKKGERMNLIVERRDYKVVESDAKQQGVVEVSILNRDILDLKKVEVNFIVLDKEQNLLGANRVVVETLGAGTRKLVKSIWPEPLKGEVATIIVEPRVNVFDPSAVLKP